MSSNNEHKKVLQKSSLYSEVWACFTTENLTLVWNKSVNLFVPEQVTRAVVSFQTVTKNIPQVVWQRLLFLVSSSTDRSHFVRVLQLVLNHC